MMPGNVLGEKDSNVAMSDNANASAKDVKSMEYHRQVLQSKMAEEPTKQYVSPSDNIMSPCTAKINALRSKTIGNNSKLKPKSLFAQASSKKIQGESSLDARPANA